MSLTVGVAHAADAAAAPTAQQSKMKTCNMDAKDKKGDERKAFMKDCLSAKPAAAAAPVVDKKTAQQEKMKTCNKDAKDKALKGDARKAFMSKCLKKDYVLKNAVAPAAEVVKVAPAKQQDKMKSCNADAASKALKGEERKTFMKSCLKG